MSQESDKKSIYDRICKYKSEYENDDINFHKRLTLEMIKYYTILGTIEPNNRKIKRRIEILKIYISNSLEKFKHSACIKMYYFGNEESSSSEEEEEKEGGEANIINLVDLCKGSEF